MSKQITVEIPETIYKQVEETARATNRRVAEVVADTLVESFLYQQTLPTLETTPDEDEYPPRAHREAMEKEVEAYKKMHSKLWEEYPHQFVAVYQGKLLAHDKDFATLVERVQATHPYPAHVVLMREVQADPEPVLYFRSPRLVRG
jgi:hypothetical protein